MKKLIHESKKQILAKLKWLGSILDVLANIFKSFAMIIGSLVAGTTAGVTGYYEIKKAIKREHHMAKLSSTGTSEAQAAGRGPASEMLTTTHSSTQIPSVPDIGGYQFDMNSGAFIISTVMLIVMVVSKLRKPTKP